MRRLYYRRQGQPPRPYPSMIWARILRQYESLRFVVFIGSAALLTWVLFVSTSSLENHVLWFCGLQFICIPLNQIGFPNAIVRLIKNWRDLKFRILVLRRNSPKAADFHLQVVLPVCGMFGHVMCVKDFSLAQKHKPSNQTGKDLLIEVNEAIETQCDERIWKPIVAMEFQKSDLAIFDWTDNVTENMRWELQVARQTLALNRIVVIARDTKLVEQLTDENICVLQISDLDNQGQCEEAIFTFLVRHLRELQPSRSWWREKYSQGKKEQQCP